MIYKYYSNFSEYAINNFINDKLCFSHVDQFNDTNEFDSQLAESLILPKSDVTLNEEQIQLQKLRIRICCFSKSPCLDNMWGYYANKSRGFCLGYDRNTLERLFPQILIKEVKYTDEPVVLNDEMTPEEIVVSQVMHKKKCWSEEKEIRASFFLDIKDMERIDISYDGVSTHKTYESVVSDVIRIDNPTFPIGFPQSQRTPFAIAAPKNILVKIEPELIIIGKNCPEHMMIVLESISKRKGIKIKHQGDIIE